MSRLVKLIFLVIIMPLMLQGQENVSIEKTTETMDTTQFARIVSTYNRIIRAQEEKLRLFKIDLIGPSLYLVTNWEEKDDSQNNILKLAYERKITPNWSWVVGSAFNADRSDHRQVDSNAGIRYYYNMKRRILKGKSANNFSGNYISTTFNFGNRFHDDDVHITWNILYGIQRRLGKRAYVDFDIGLENIFNAYNNRESGTDLFASLSWGLAF